MGSSDAGKGESAGEGDGDWGSEVFDVTMKHKALWRQVFKSTFTPESIDKAVIRGDHTLLEEKPPPKSLRDSIAGLESQDRASKFDLYLQLKAKIPNASSDTLRKLRRRLGIE